MNTRKATLGLTIIIALFIGLFWGGLIALLSPVAGGICGGGTMTLAFFVMVFFQGANR